MDLMTLISGIKDAIVLNSFIEAEPDDPVLFPNIVSAELTEEKDAIQLTDDTGHRFLVKIEDIDYQETA